MASLGSPWFLGLILGILGGSLTALLVNLLFAWPEKHAYAQRLAAANRKVIDALKPNILEGETPKLEMVKSLLSAMARKHSVAASDMHSIADIAETLTQEVMEASFIPASTKTDFCRRLTNLKNAFEAEAQAPEKQDTLVVYTTAARYRRQTAITLGLSVGLLTIALGIALTIRALNGPYTWVILSLPTLIGILVNYGVRIASDAQTMLLGFLEPQSETSGITPAPTPPEEQQA